MYRNLDEKINTIMSTEKKKSSSGDGNLGSDRAGKNLLGKISEEFNKLQLALNPGSDADKNINRDDLLENIYSEFKRLNEKINKIDSHLTDSPASAYPSLKNSDTPPAPLTLAQTQTRQDEISTIMQTSKVPPPKTPSTPPQDQLHSPISSNPGSSNRINDSNELVRLSSMTESNTCALERKLEEEQLMRES